MCLTIDGLERMQILVVPGMVDTHHERSSLALKTNERNILVLIREYDDDTYWHH